MPIHPPALLPPLQVIAIGYQDSQPVVNDAKGLAVYKESGVYAAAGVDFAISKPRFPEEERTEAEPRNLGLLNGAIANAVAEARQEGRVVLMTGGNCSHITGIFGGLQDAHGAGTAIGLVWFDAHGDFNTPQTSITGRLFGMPVAVCAGLALPEWREASHLVAPLPTDRIVMVDVRNLDPAEETLVRAVGIPIVSVGGDFPGAPLGPAVDALAQRCDALYLHVDADILDERFLPDNGTPEPNGPDVSQVLAAVDRVMATGKVLVYAVVAVSAGGPGREISLAAGKELIRGGLESWQRYGAPPLGD